MMDVSDGIDSLMTDTPIPLIPLIPREVKKRRTGRTGSSPFTEIFSPFEPAASLEGRPLHAHENQNSSIDDFTEIFTLAEADIFPVQGPLHVQENQDSPVDALPEILTNLAAAVAAVLVPAAFGGINMTQGQMDHQINQYAAHMNMMFGGANLYESTSMDYRR